MKFIRLGYVAVVLVAIGAALAAGPLWGAVASVLFLWPALRHLRRQFTKLSIGGDKLRHETGMAAKSTRTIQLSKIQDVRVDQTLFQRLFGVGNLAIETAGETSRLVVANVDAPQPLADHLIELAQKGFARGV